MGIRALFLMLVIAMGQGCSSGGSTATDPPDQVPPPNAPVVGRSVFPADNAWNRDVSVEPVDPNSANLIASCGATRSLHPDFGTVYDGVPWGIPYVTVRANQARVPVSFYYADESDPGPYPIPPTAPSERGASPSADRHVIVVDVDTWMLYDRCDARTVNGGASWTAGSGAIFDLSSNAMRPAGWTSADAAGLPVFAGLARYEEVAAEAIPHALRFTRSATRRAYPPPARPFPHIPRTSCRERG